MEKRKKLVGMFKQLSKSDKSIVMEIAVELKKRGISEVDADMLLSTFLYYFLDNAHYSVEDCLTYTKLWEQMTADVSDDDRSERVVDE